MGLSLRIFIFLTAIINSNKLEIIVEWEVIRINSINIHLIFIFDLLSFYFIRLVSLVSGRVILFSNAYIIKEKFFSRFILLVFLFILSICLLVFFYQSRKSYNAGILTALTNRVGDVGLLISISLILFQLARKVLKFHFQHDYQPP